MGADRDSPSPPISLHQLTTTSGPLSDRLARNKRKLRISLTDRCNFRCWYCMPETPEWLPRSELLSYEEIARLCRLFVADMGITELRLTGGEPLLRKDVPMLIESLQALRDRGLQRIALTSNGVYLPRLAPALVAAGLDDINISIDARDPQRFRALTGGDLAAVLKGIEAARTAGLQMKLNAVVVRGRNDDQLLPLLDWAMAEALPLRFIEFMPLDGGGGWAREHVVTEAEMLAPIRARHRVEAQPETADPARYYLIDGGFRLGIISTISRPFCRRCDRLRLSSNGGLYSCLFSAQALDLRAPMRGGDSDAQLAVRIRAHVWNKEAGYAERAGYVERPISMHHLGG